MTDFLFHNFIEFNMFSFIIVMLITVVTGYVLGSVNTWLAIKEDNRKTSIKV